MNASLKTINANIKTITAQGGKLDTLATQTAQLIIEHGETTRHYDRAAALVNALSFNQRLQKQVISAFVGRIPHSLRVVANEYKLGKRDESLLHSAEELETIAEQKAAKRQETTAKQVEKREEKNRKLAEFDKQAAIITKLTIENTQLKKELAKLQKTLAKTKPVQETIAA